MFCIGSYGVITITIRSERFPGVQLSDVTNKCRLFVLPASPHWGKPVWLRALFWKYIAFVWGIFLFLFLVYLLSSVSVKEV